MKLIEKVITIIKKTHDGDDLTPQELKLTELAANGFLNEKGEAKIEELYQAVMSGTYRRPSYLGVEHMDRDHEGYVYFKGQDVEHYSSFWAYSLAAEAELKKLQQQCLFLEKRGISVHEHLKCLWSMNGEYAEEFCLAQKKELDALVQDGAMLFSVVKTKHDSFLAPGHPFYEDVLGSPRYHDIYSFRKRLSGFTVTSYVYGSGREWAYATEEELDRLNCCLDYLKDKNHLQFVSEETYAAPHDQQIEKYMNKER